MEIIKDSHLMGKLLMKEIDRDFTKDMIIKNHYSHKWNTSFGKINIGIFKVGNDECLGVASFGNLMNPKSFKSFNKDFNQDSIIELNRLWIDDVLGKNAETILLGASWKIIREKYPHIKAVQSFADGRLGCGTIYKASNFNYYGFTETLFYENIETKETQHKVPMENTMRPDGMIKLNVQMALGLLKPFYVKTYKYVYPLYKNTILEMKEQEYPEYDKGQRDIINYKHSMALFMRAMMLAFILDQKDDFKILYNYLKENLHEMLIIDEYEKGIKNDSIQLISKERKLEQKYDILKNSIFETLTI